MSSLSRTDRDYAHGWVDPVAQVERDAYRRGYNRGALECAVWIAALIVVYVVIKPAVLIVAGL